MFERIEKSKDSAKVLFYRWQFSRLTIVLAVNLMDSSFCYILDIEIHCLVLALRSNVFNDRNLQWTSSRYFHFPTLNSCHWTIRSYFSPFPTKLPGPWEKGAHRGCYNWRQWRRRGGTRGTSPPRNWKNCCRKMMLFPKALFLATTFPKIDKNAIFLMNFYQRIFSKFPNNLYISSKRAKN